MPKKVVGKPMKNTEEYVWDVYEETPLMPTYTVAFAVFVDHISHTESFIDMDNITKNISAWIDDDIKNGREKIIANVNHTLKISKFFEEYFQKAIYPVGLPKTDNLETISNRYAAMENWGLILYYKRKRDVNDSFSYFDHSIDSQGTIAHELAHYYFGNPVTCKNWTE